MTERRKPNDVLAVIDALPSVLRTVRIFRGLSLREAAQQMGMSFSTLTRIENGEECNLSNARAAIAWIGGRR